MFKNMLSSRHAGLLFRRALFLAAVGWSALLFHACEESDEIGLGLIDRRATVSSTDTLGIQAHTLLSDTVATSTSRQGMLGVVNDPVFGRMRTSVYTQVTLPFVPFDFRAEGQEEDELELDSLVLRLAYSGRYIGDIDIPQTLRAYELAASFPDDERIYSNFRLEHLPTSIGSRRFVPAPADSVMLDTIPLPPHISIRLSDELGQRMLDADPDSLETVPSFKRFFKGLYLVMDADVDGPGAIFNIDLQAPFTSLRLYYQRSLDDTTRTQNTVDFRVDEIARRFTHVEHFEYEGLHPLLQAQAIDGNETSGDSLLFVQSLGRFSAFVDIPDLQQLSRPNMAINQARLIVPFARDFDSELFPPASSLYLYRYNEDHELVPLSDMFLDQDYFGGGYQAEQGWYRMNITRYVQEVVDGHIPNNGLLLVVGSSAERAERTVLHGPGRSQDRMRLEVIYTLFD